MLAFTGPRAERRALHNVALQGADGYAPLARLPDGRVELLFPRYLFVFIEAQWYWLRSTRGVCSIVMAGGMPAHVPIEQIESMWSAERGGVIPLGFEPGQMVALDAWGRRVLAQYLGKSGPQRSRVLIEMLGRWTTIEVETRELHATNDFRRLEHTSETLAAA